MAVLAPDPEGGGTPVVVWTSPSGHRWWVRAPQLEPPPWERDPDIDPESADADLAGLANPRATDTNDADRHDDTDSWRRASRSAGGVR